MKITNKDNFLNYLNSLRFLGVGSQGACYYDPKTNQVLKVFHIFFDNDNDYGIFEDLTQFSNITNSTFIWPIETIEYKSFVIGYTMKFVKSKSLYEINPLYVNLNSFAKAINKSYKDIELLTNNDIKIYDIMYNILYSKGKINVIDTMEYSKRNVTLKENSEGFNLELKYFLVDNLFNNFVNSNSFLRDLYDSKDANALEFLNELKRKLSEYIGFEITMLNEVRMLTSKIDRPKYIREISKRWSSF